MHALRRNIAATGLVAAAVLVAIGAALVLDRLLPGIAAAPPAAGALVVAAVFAVRASEGLVAFVTFTLLADTVEHWLGLDLLLFDEISVLLLAVVAVVRHGAPNDRLRIGVPEVSLVVLAIAGIASSAVEGVAPLTVFAGLALLFKAIALFYVVSWLRLSVEDVTRMGVVVIVIGVTIGLLGAVEWLNPAAFQAALGLPPFASARADVTVVRSIFLHPAQYGWLTTFTSLIFYAIFLTRRAWWALPIAIALNLGTVVSGRRTPLVGVVGALAVGLAWQLRHARTRLSLARTWLPLGVALVILGVMLLPMLGNLYRYTVSEYMPSEVAVTELFAADPDSEVVSALHPRTALYLGSVAVARDRLPFGAGFGRYGSHLSRAEYSPIYTEYGLDKIYLLGPDRPDAVTDTFWPMVLAETGVIGLLAALVFFGHLLVRVWRAASAATSPAGRTIGLAVLMVFVEGLVRSLTASVYTAPPIAYFVLGAAGLALAVRRTADEHAAQVAG